jgi:uncharacterized protein with GYD domain
MAKYLVNVSYTLEGVKGLRNDGGTKREDVVRKTLEGLGGKLEAFYFTMGDRDAFVIAELPDALAAAALSVSVAAAGGARCSTTPLLTPADMDHACERKTAYKGPGIP